MTADESKSLCRGARVYWQGDAADSGTITESNWNAVTIAWKNGHTATVHHGDMREVASRPFVSESSSAYPISTPTRRMRSGCCARAIAGHAAAAPAGAMNSRRFI